VAQLWLPVKDVPSAYPSSAIVASGKFLSRGSDKFFLKAMRLPEVGGTLDLNRKLELARRLEDLRAAHTTALILGEAQVHPVLDLAAHTGLYAFIELAIAPVDLLDCDRFADAMVRVAHTASIWRDHPALIGYLIDFPIAPDVLRERGVRAFQRSLRRLIHAIRERAGGALIALKHRPATAALAMEVEDFLYASVGGLKPAELTRFVLTLHNLAMARPVIVEFPQWAADQDEMIATAFGLGTAGVVASPAPRADSSRWITIRTAGAEEVAPFLSLNGTCPPAPPRAPMVSVVICAYNAERTMRQCLKSLRGLRYSNYEVVIVDDGSRDRTAEIAMEFPEFRLIRQPNKGLSEARNVGLRAARGEVVAYTDSDCVVDPDWLNLMMRAMVEGGFDGCGGPNYAPHEKGWVEACVAVAPGAPSHVLFDADRAEHLAGCNMAFSKAALLHVGGFDPQFTSAGDDVDICWRMLQAGYRLGYCPAAFVWHFRRNTAKAYFGQQRGYGRAEAALYLKYPEQFNALGQIRWHGTIPGLMALLPGGAVRQRIGWPRTVTQQTLGETAPKILDVLPQTLEWHLSWTAATLCCWLVGETILPTLAMLLLGAVWALYYAWRAPLERCHDSLGTRFFVALLAWTAPVVRTWARWRTRLRAGSLQTEVEPRQRPSLRPFARSLNLAYWNTTWTTSENLLDRLAQVFSRAGIATVTDPGWNDFDLEARPDPWTRIRLKTADEEHEGGRLKNHVAVRVRLSSLSQCGLAVGIAGVMLGATLGMAGMAAVLAAITLASALCAASQAIESGRLAFRAVEQCAAELNLMPLGKPTAAALAATPAIVRKARPPIAASLKLFDNRPAVE
jgi:O-antigen biosynthesis protein